MTGLDGLPALMAPSGHPEFLAPDERSTLRFPQYFHGARLQALDCRRHRE
jgi:hypothetical protein